MCENEAFPTFWGQCKIPAVCGGWFLRDSSGFCSWSLVPVTIVADWNQTSYGSVASVCDLWLPLCSVVVRRRHGRSVVGSRRLARGGHTPVNGKTKPPHLSDRPSVDSRCVSKPCTFLGVPWHWGEAGRIQYTDFVVPVPSFLTHLTMAEMSENLWRWQ